MGALTAKNDLPQVTDYLPEGDIAALGDLRLQSPIPIVEHKTVEAPPPVPQPPPPKAVEQSPEVTAQPHSAPQLPPDPPAVAALRAYLDPTSDAARELFARLSETDRFVLDTLAFVVARAGTGKLEHATPAEIDQVLKQAELLEGKLRPRGSLALGQVCFTRHIEGFGAYEPLPAPDGCPVFLGGLEGRPGERVQVYVEVRNFGSRKVGPYWETALASALEVRSMNVVNDPDCRVLRRPARPDRSLSQRQDYFLNIQFHVPPRLPRGRYQLRVTVTDDITSRSASGILDFRVEPPR
jgi:hypothetical protein